ncbi:histone-lysine N-methyltransferase ASH1L [Blastomyces dermatitidis ER-3]|uniref:Histone-lysine N-methyltransferase ASH1L n=1 Tax=Ajellomyces dermatitidis (strain ER-3 / ATCC MYA-2586) TaxID=559297 RepID=A0ABP2F3Q2_AJEDR|nr:histone-lysine N-methyltransferase ASH1L [Blastomyces dermatitidis ER-3]EEQ90812.2 histone-lysine N-methyltransferase ASH1L [Blastomyces dermatitidis ER-3]
MARLSRSSGTSPSSTPSSALDSKTTSISTEHHLLTPATSQSESSSMNDAAALELEKAGLEVTPATERRSRRVTRSSLMMAAGGAVREERGLIMSDDDERVTRHPLRSNPLDHPEVAGGVEVEREGQAENVAKEEEHLSNDELGKNTLEIKKKDGSEDRARRRSSRLVMLEKTSEMVGRASTVLGKRSREAMLKGKDRLKVINRRASLRPRNVVCETSTPSTTPTSTADGPVLKKRRVSEGDAVASKKSSDSTTVGDNDTQPPKPKTVPYKRKKWLSHGLYAGQDRYFDPRLTEEKNRIKFAKKNAEERKKVFPLPMFAGERLIEDGRDFKLPFDIFSPLPPGQPKPDEWRKTNKIANCGRLDVFVGDAACIWKAIKLGECSTCMCTPESGCDENCQNRYMFYECDDNNCKLGAELCGNRNFEGLRQRSKLGGKYNIGVEVIKTADRGYGVRSNRTFAPNQIIVEYTGEIVTQEECERRMRTCYYLMYFDRNMIIDATRGSIARFVNHSCEPNCKIEKWTVAGKPRMALFAGEHGIMTGEELTYDYNFDPYSQKNVQECRCGAPTCRGVLGPKPKDSKKQENSNLSKNPKKMSASKTVAGKKRKQEKVLDESSTSRLNKRRKVLKPVSKSLKAGIKKAAAGARSATNSTKKAKTKAKPKTKTTTTAKAKSAPTKKTKLRPRPKAAAKTRVATANQKTQKYVVQTPSQAQSQGNTKLNRPTKKLNSISAARTTSRTPAAMRRLLEAEKKSVEHENTKEETRIDKAISKLLHENSTPFI